MTRTTTMMHIWGRRDRHPHRDPVAGAAALRGLLAFVLLLAATPAAGQALQPKRALAPGPDSTRCAPGSAPAAAGEPAPAAVDSLLAEGSRAAILGDHYRAGELLREAANLDPRNSVVAYRLARTYEERGEAALAVGEYCRYILLFPGAPDSAEVRERVRSLAATVVEGDREELAATVRAGLDAYDGRRFEGAALAFTRVVDMRPRWAAAHFNRALAHLALGRRAEAAAGLQAYLDLLPDAEDRGQVEALLPTLRVSPDVPLPVSPAPAGVLLRGLVVPGLGQYATGRPVAAVMVLAGSAAAVAYGLKEELVVRTATANDPFGNPYEYEVRSTERTRLGTGLGIAAAVAAAGAVEAYFHARGGPSFELPPPAGRFRLHLSAAPAAGGLRLTGRLLPPP